MPQLPDKPYFVELAEKELFAAVGEWTVDVACAPRELTPVEERLFRASTNYLKAQQITAARKGSGVHRVDPRIIKKPDEE